MMMDREGGGEGTSLHNAFSAFPCINTYYTDVKTRHSHVYACVYIYSPGKMPIMNNRKTIYTPLLPLFPPVTHLTHLSYGIILIYFIDGLRNSPQGIS